MLKTKLNELTFDNRYANELTADDVTINTRRQVEGASYSRVMPTAVRKPVTAAYSKEMAAAIDLDEAVCQSQEFAEVFGGNKIIEGMDPYAMCYGGHQFGHWAGQLGDGRAINLGEALNNQGEHWTLQLKGAGPTPYSRRADGLAVLRSSVREFLCSEAMHHLGVPTTRALSLITTGEDVMRDMFYDGNAKFEPGAVVCRMAPSFVRFGNFEIFAARQDHVNLKKLVDFTIRNNFPHLGEVNHESIGQWFHEVCQRTAKMVIEWMRVGFVHGVMNTDNMSILGLTIDYGPYGWQDNFDLDWTPNTTDFQSRRYRFGNQAYIAQWNCLKLANALYPLLNEQEPFQSGLKLFVKEYETGWDTMMAHKCGLKAFNGENDNALIGDLLNVLSKVETDMTLFFRKLATVPSDIKDVDNAILLTPLKDAYYDYDNLKEDDVSAMTDWIRRYQIRLKEDGLSDDERLKNMNQVNPKYVLRNYIAQLAIDKAEQDQDYSLINELLEILRHPYDEQPSKEEYAAKRPEWARHRAGCSTLSCSS